MPLLLPKKVSTPNSNNPNVEHEYISHVEAEYRYFEYVNTLRLLSRQLFTQINPDGDENAAKRIDEVLGELRKKLLNYNEHFSSRFLNEEVRCLEFYEEGSALRHLATVKELFATHIALLWMTVKHLRGSLQDKTLTSAEVEKLQFLEKTIKDLVSSEHLMNEILFLLDTEEGKQAKYTAKDLRTLLDSFEGDRSPANDTQKLLRLQ